MKITDEAVQAALEYYSEGGCMGLDSYERKEVVKSMLEAALPHLQPGYEVKKLEWVGFNGSSAVYNYTIAPPDHTKGWRVWVKLADKNASIGGAIVTMSAADELEAKAAAQADFERRVRECVVDGSNAQGWLYFNEDTGTEYSADHPVISGECPDAQDIKPATNENLFHELLSSWKAWAEDRQEIDDLRAEIAVKPVDVAAVRRQAFEEAATVAEKYDGMPCGAATGWPEDEVQHYMTGQQDASSSIAYGIRDLSAEPAKPQTCEKAQIDYSRISRLEYALASILFEDSDKSEQQRMIDRVKARAVLEAAEPVQGEQWLPMDSVPKDNTVVILKYGDKICFAEWWEAAKKWQYLQAPHSNSLASDLWFRGEPDGWMHLPAAPTSEAGR